MITERTLSLFLRLAILEGRSSCLVFAAHIGKKGFSNAGPEAGAGQWRGSYEFLAVALLPEPMSWRAES